MHAGDINEITTHTCTYKTSNLSYLCEITRIVTLIVRLVRFSSQLKSLVIKKYQVTAAMSCEYYAKFCGYILSKLCSMQHFVW